jgi:hypothetical protein
MDDARMAALTDDVRATAHRISADLGWRPPSEAHEPIADPAPKKRGKDKG